MKPLRDAPIRQKLIFVTMTTVAASLLVAGLVFYVSDYRSFRRYVSQDVSTTAGLVAENVKAAVAFGDPGATIETLGSLRAKPYIASACVYDGAGAVIAAYARSGASPTCPPALRPDGSYRDGRNLLVFRPVSVDGTRVGTVFLRRTLEDVDRHLDMQSSILAGVMAVALAIGLLLANGLQRVVSRPVAELAATARAVSLERDYSLRATRHGGDELGTMVDAFNDMLAHIQQRTAELQETRARLEHTVHELQEASRLKDEFLATLSHELRTPLNAILGWARMLRVNQDIHDEKRARAIESIERNAIAQARIVDDLLDVSRIVTGKLRLEVRPVNLAPIAAAALEVVRPSAEARQVRLAANLADRGGDVVLGDADRLQQMIWNLLANSVKFTPAGGEVRIELQPPDAPGAPASGTVEMRIVDTGRGIEPEFLPFAFDLFRQADSSSTREHGGLGLGLALAREIAELHGGTIRLDSAGANRGTVATVTLPAANRS